MKKGQQYLFFFLMFLAVLSLFRMFSPPATDEIKYSRFKKLLAEKQVKDIVVTGETIRGTVKEGDKEKPFATVRIADPDLLKELEASGAAYEGSPLRLFTTRPDSPESRSMGLADNMDLLSVSSSGELAVSLNNHGSRGPANQVLAMIPTVPQKMLFAHAC